jgi:hypothetical protein
VSDNDSQRGALTVATLLLALTLFFSRSAAQDTASEAELSWVRLPGSEGCADARTVRSEVAKRLGRNPFGTAGATSIEATTEREDGYFIAQIVARGPDGKLLGSRTLTSEAARCDSLVRAASLAIALVIDPEAAQRVAAQRSADGALKGQREDQVLAGSAAGTRTNSLGADLRGVLARGLLPGLNPGVALGVELRSAYRVGAIADVYYFPEQRARLEGSSFAFGMTAFALGTCVEALRRAVGLSVCAAGQLGTVHSVVFDLPAIKPGPRLWAAASLGARLTIPLGPLRVFAAVHGTAPITRLRFRASGVERSVFRQSAIAASGELGVGLHFP